MARNFMRAMMVAAGLAAATASAAQDAPATQKKIALVIGNGDYVTAPRLANPVNDAVDVASTLSTLGFDVIDGYDLDYGGMQEKVRDFARALEGADVGLFFYAGHGLQVDGKNYMVPVDAALADEGAVDFETVDMNSVISRLSAPDRTSLVFLDACRDNPLLADLARQAAAARSVAVAGGLAPPDAGAANLLVAYSAQPGATASDGAGRNSPFTSAILHHIETPGLDVQQLMRRVRSSVIEQSEGLQVPFDNSSLTSDFFFVRPAAGQEAPPPVENWAPPQRDPSPRQIEVGLWNDVKNTGSLPELESYLAQYAEGIFAEAVRARIATLKQAESEDAEKAQVFAEAIAKEFAALTGRGNIVDDPKEPQDFYANARLYELRGDYLNARRAYLGFFDFALPYVDPHYRFQTFLKVQEGRAGAREIYNELVDQKPADVARAYAAALLWDADVRIERLEAHVAAHPDFAPAYYELSRDFSQARLGAQTLAQKKREYELLTTFVDLVDAGEFLKHFIDQELAAEQIEDARTRLQLLESTVAQIFDAPMNFSAMRSNSGWTISVFASGGDRAKEIFYKAGAGDFRSTGFSNVNDPATGAPMPVSYFDLPQDAGPQTIEVKYMDLNGDEQGPFPYRFDPAAALISGAKQVIEATSNGWVAFREYDGKLLFYFTHLQSNRCGVARAVYGFDTDEPNIELPIADCDLLNPNAVGDGVDIYLEAPLEAAYATVRVFYKDGTSSEVKRFNRL